MYSISFSFISLTDRILREISVVEIVQCTVSMCLLGYNIIMVYKYYTKSLCDVKHIPISEQCLRSCVLYSDMYNISPNIKLIILQEWESQKTTSYITYTVLLLSFTFNIFIFCYIGELIAEKVSSITVEAFLCISA